MAYRGSIEYSDSFDDGLPSHIYYNAQIINNRTDDFDAYGVAYPNPPIRFNETRDAAIIKDCSKYNYSIVRFSMNGPNLTLPLFIPTIQTGQSNPNLTTYAFAISLQQTWNVTLDGVNTPVSFELAPTPTNVIYVPENNNRVIAPLPSAPSVVQDVNTPYYFVFSYQSVVDMFNTALSSALEATFNLLQTAWISPFAIYGKPVGTISTPFPYSGFKTGATPFLNNVNLPVLVYNPVTQLFTFNLDSDAFGPRIKTFVAGALAGTPRTPPQCRLFMNNNTYGLLSNFETKYWNLTTIPGLAYPVPEGYVWEVMVRNRGYSNIQDQTSTAFQGSGGVGGYAPPNVNALGWTPAGGTPSNGNPNQNKVIYLITQDFLSTDSLWSPIGSIVFTTTLLPIKTEATGVPVILGASNIGNTTATSQSAFQPIVTDIALDTSADGASGYRKFIYYAPAAEYRMSDLTSSHLDIRSIDIQVYFKNRLNNNLYPVTMFNLSSVDFKMLFRHKRVSEGKGHH